MDGPLHFCASPSSAWSRPLGSTLARRRLLRSLASPLAVVPTQEWYALGAAQQAAGDGGAAGASAACLAAAQAVASAGAGKHDLRQVAQEAYLRHILAEAWGTSEALGA